MKKEEVNHLRCWWLSTKRHGIISQNPITLIFMAVGFLAVFKFWWSVYEVQSVIYKNLIVWPVRDPNRVQWICWVQFKFQAPLYVPLHDISVGGVYRTVNEHLDESVSLQEIIFRSYKAFCCDTYRVFLGLSINVLKLSCWYRRTNLDGIMRDTKYK